MLEMWKKRFIMDTSLMFLRGGRESRICTQNKLETNALSTDYTMLFFLVDSRRPFFKREAGLRALNILAAN